MLNLDKYIQKSVIFSNGTVHPNKGPSLSCCCFMTSGARYPHSDLGASLMGESCRPYYSLDTNSILAFICTLEI